MSETPWLTDYEQRVTDWGARVQRARTELAGITETATAGAGAVIVTVGATGLLRQISFGERADELSRPALADAILDASRRAHAAALRRSGELMETLLGGTAAAQVMTEYRPPAPEPASERASPDR
jgi:DNA-binding protein YbaB